MMYPILCKVRFEQLNRIFSKRALWLQLGFSCVINWIIAPLVMVLIIIPSETNVVNLLLVRFGVGIPAGQTIIQGRFNSRRIGPLYCNGTNSTSHLPICRYSSGMTLLVGTATIVRF